MQARDTAEAPLSYEGVYGVQPCKESGRETEPVADFGVGPQSGLDPGGDEWVEADPSHLVRDLVSEIGAGGSCGALAGAL